MSNDDLITINADILQVTDAAVLIDCGGEEVWLPLSQIDFDGERGDANVSVSLPEWLADEKGLSEGDGMIRATVTNFRTGLPMHEHDGNTCRNCVFSVLADDENEPLPFECAECTRSGLVGGTVDNWTDGGEATPDNDDKDDDETVPMPAEPAFLKTETITVSVPLAPEERESVGDRMASALEQIAELEDDLDSYRKSINAQIKSLQKDAEAARKEWQEGKTEQEVYCDVMADYEAEAIVWIDHDNGAKMKRRPMTAEERQYRLPIPRPGDGASTPPSDPADEQTAPPPVDETIGTPPVTNRHTCLDCGHMNNGEDGTQAEECASCSQSGSGEIDQWTPRRECRTCAHSHDIIDMPPCKGCVFNVMPEHRGDEERWEWEDTSKKEMSC